MNEVTGNKNLACLKSPRRELLSPHNAFAIGFKCARAVKNWHGSWGFGQSGDDGCGGTYPSTPNQTKYRTLTSYISSSTVVHNTDSSGGNTTNTNGATINRSWTVDRFSGGKKIVTANQTYTDITSFNNEAALLESFSGVCGSIAFNSSILTIPPWNTITSPIDPATLQSDLNFHNHSTGSFGTYFDELSSGTASMTRTSLSITQNYSSDQYTQDSMGNWTRSQSTFTLTVTMNFSDPYLASDVHVDIDLLLQKVSICGLPWRNDTACGTGSFAQYNEGTKNLPEDSITISDTVGTITYASSLPDVTQLPGAELIDRSNTLTVSGSPRGAFVAYTGDGLAPNVFPTAVGQLIKGIWMEQKLPFKSFNWSTGSGTAPSAGTYLLRIWIFDYRDITITPSLRPNTGAWKDMTCGQYTASGGQSILIAPSNYCALADYFNLSSTTLLDPLGSFLQMDVSQVMFDPTKPYVPPLTNPVSLGNYNPVGAGAALVEAVNAQPFGPPLPTNSRPLDNASGFVTALNAVYPANENTAAPVNPENYFVISAGDGETGQITGTLPWKNYP